MHRLVILLFLASGLASPLSAQQRNALILYSYHDELPWQKSVRAGIQERLSSYSDSFSLELYVESLDNMRLINKSTTKDWAHFLTTKYKYMDFDLVITESGPAASFLVDHPEMFPDAKKYFVNPGAATLGKKSSNALYVEEDVERALRVTLEMRPDARKLIVIGNLLMDRIDRIRAAWSKNHRDQVKLEVWVNDFTFDELYQRVAQLPPDAVIFYGLVSHDSTGARLTPYAALKPLVQSASVPVFVMHDTLIGTGSVGGYVQSGKKLGWAMADLLAGAQPKDFSAGFFSQYLFDGKALRKWQIPSEFIPSNSTILNPQLSAWEAYKFEIIVALVIASIGFLILLALARALHGKRAAMARLSDAHAQMEVRIDERTAQLRKANTALAETSIRDELTQLSNRRRFDEVMDIEFKRLRRSRAVLSLIMLDLDFFKGLNDSLGHVAGDECLIQIAKVLDNMAGRVTDVAVRYGGEEFVIILPETDFEGAFSRAEEIRRRIIDINIPNPASTVRNCVTASFGVVSLVPTSVDSVKDIVELADEQLYIAKDKGRNRVEGRDYSAMDDIKVKHKTNVIELSKNHGRSH